MVGRTPFTMDGKKQERQLDLNDTKGLTDDQQNNTLKTKNHGGQGACSPQASSLTNQQHHQTPSTKLQTHIWALYGVVLCLTLVLVSSLVFGYLEITSLRAAVSKQVALEDVVELYFPDNREPVSEDDIFRPYSSPEDELSLGGFYSKESAPKGDRRKRALGHQEGSGAGDDWLWMGSFARVQLTALTQYCKESKSYCASKGPPGEKGEKGDSSGDIANNLSNLEALRGPPGPAGPPGATGEPGSPGVPGVMGRPGPPGQDGKDGLPGDRGLTGMDGAPGMPGMPGDKGNKGESGGYGSKGDRGMSGTPGLPGHKGEMGETGRPGPQGPPGPKGDVGYCGAPCLDSSYTNQYKTEPTTPIPTFPPRKAECSIDIIGKPVFVKSTPSKFGTWMVDVKPTAESANKIWVTLGLENDTVLEYSSQSNFENGIVARELNLSGTPFFGTGHAVSGGFLYYHWAHQQKIVRYNLALGEVTTVRQLPDLNHKPAKGSKTYLYSSESVFVDFNVDANGLWIIYGVEGNSKMMVALLNEETLDIVKSVKVGVQLSSKGNAFIACGKLYTVRHHNRQSSFLDEEHDLWNNKTRPIRITFNNPYGNTVMLTYDNANKRLLAWDAENQLSSPLLVNNDK